MKIYTLSFISHISIMHVIVDSIWDNTEMGSISVLEMLHANTFILSVHNVNTLALEAICFEKTLSKTQSWVFL